MLNIILHSTETILSPNIFAQYLTSTASLMKVFYIQIKRNAPRTVTHDYDSLTSLKAVILSKTYRNNFFWEALYIDHIYMVQPEIL